MNISHKKITTLTIEEGKKINDLLKEKSAIADFGDDEVIYSFTAKFNNGYQSDIRLINSEDGPFLDLTLFDDEGSEITCLDPMYELPSSILFEDIDEVDYQIDIVPF